jgi:hypothetical protein
MCKTEPLSNKHLYKESAHKHNPGSDNTLKSITISVE